MMLLPIDDLLDEERCQELLRDALHPDGLHGPVGHALPADQAPHTRHRAPIVEYRCRVCTRVFNLFSETLWSGVRHPCSRLVRMLRGCCQGATTLHRAIELGISRRHLSDWRHRVQGFALERIAPLRAPRRGRRSRRDVPERGRDGPPASHDPDDPPRRRASAFDGHGTLDNDRPPVFGAIGRASGDVVVRQAIHGTRRAPEPLVIHASRPDAIILSDGWDTRDAYDPRTAHARE